MEIIVYYRCRFMIERCVADERSPLVLHASPILIPWGRREGPFKLFQVSGRLDARYRH